MRSRFRCPRLRQDRLGHQAKAERGFLRDAIIITNVSLHILWNEVKSSRDRTGIRRFSPASLKAHRTTSTPPNENTRYQDSGRNAHIGQLRESARAGACGNATDLRRFPASAGERCQPRHPGSGATLVGQKRCQPCRRKLAKDEGPEGTQSTSVARPESPHSRRGTCIPLLDLPGLIDNTARLLQLGQFRPG